MQRRDFIRFLSLFGAMTCAGCSFREEAQVPERIPFPKSASLTFIKIPVCYHCNSNCAYCLHFAPLAPKYEMPPEVFEKDIKQLKSLSGNSLQAIRILGGEPLLNKKIEEILKLSVKYFPYARQTLLTNGLLLKDMPESFYKTCKNLGVDIEVSKYPKYKEYFESDAYKKLKEKHDDINFIEYERDTFTKVALSNGEAKEDKYNWHLCHKQDLSGQLDCGKLTVCGIMDYVKFFNAYFPEHAIPMPEDYYLDIHKVSSMEEIIEYYNTPKEFCKHCHYGHNGENVAWKPTNRELSEWAV